MNYPLPMRDLSNPFHPANNGDAMDLFAICAAIELLFLTITWIIRNYPLLTL